jgi:hypothetical protein
MNDLEAISAVLDEMYVMISRPAGPGDGSHQPCVPTAAG